MVLEQATQRAIEKVFNNQTQSTSYNTLKSEAVSAAHPPASPKSPPAMSPSTIGWSATARQTNMTFLQRHRVYARYINVQIQRKFTPYFGTQYFPRQQRRNSP